MLTELEPKDFHKAIPLFQGFDYSLSLPATLAGNNPGYIFVDNPKKPKAAFALTVEGNFLAGNPADNLAVEAVSQFLRKKIFTGEIYLDDNTSISLAVEPIEWEAKLPKMIPTHEIEKRPRYHYLCQELSFDWRAHLSPGYQVRSFNQNLLDDRFIVIPEEINEWASIEIRWGSLENFLEHAVSTCVIHQNKVVTICSADCFTEDRIDVGIFTLPEHRRSGLATIASAATVEAAFKKGFQKVGWHCHTDNIAYWKTAEKVGFKREQTYLYYFYVFDVIDHLAALGWFSFKRGEFQKTTNFYERVFSARNENPDYYYHLTAVAWAGLKNEKMAIQYLNTAIDHGWRNRDFTEQEEMFIFLHGSQQWKAALNRMSAKK